MMQGDNKPCERLVQNEREGRESTVAQGAMRSSAAMLKRRVPRSRVRRFMRWNLVTRCGMSHAAFSVHTNHVQPQRVRYEDVALLSCARASVVLVSELSDLSPSLRWLAISRKPPEAFDACSPAIVFPNPDNM